MLKNENEKSNKAKKIDHMATYLYSFRFTELIPSVYR